MRFGARLLFVVALLLGARLAHAAPELAGLSYVEAGPADGPVVVALHWQGGDPHDLVAAITARAPALHVYAPSAGASRSWYEGSSTAARNPTLQRSVERLIAFVTALEKQHGRIVVAGYSQGGILALALAVARPDLVAAVVAVSARLPASFYARFTDGKTKPLVVLLHGDADATIPFASGEKSAAALRAHGYTVELRSFAHEGHGLSSARLAAFAAALERLAVVDKSGVASPSQ